MTKLFAKLATVVLGPGALLLACGTPAFELPGEQSPPTEGWSQQFGSEGDDGASSVAIDSGGNVFVAGWTSGAGGQDVNAGGRDAFVAKYLPNGKGAWTRLAGSPLEDSAEAVAVDGAGNIFVAGRTSEALASGSDVGNGDAFVAAYSPDGKPLWTRQFGTTELDWADGVAVDPEGNVVVTGSTAGAFPGQSRAAKADNFVRKYDREGTEVWTKQFGSEEGNGSMAVAVDRWGNVYVAGSTLGPIPGTTHIGSGDVFVRKYDRAGMELWTREDGTPAGDAATGVAMGATGDLYVVGSTRGVFPDEVRIGGFLDAFLLKYDPAGQPLATWQFGTAGSDLASGVAVDSGGNIYVVGRTDGSMSGYSNLGGFDAFARKLSPKGDVLWTRQFGSKADDYAYGVAVDTLGNVYVAGLGLLGPADPLTLPDAFLVQFQQGD